jgi:excinuclease UvrABC nuclease subunit
VTLQGERYRFSDDDISHAPERSGIYVLYNGPQIIFIGKATGTQTIKSKLQSHKKGNEGPCTRHATHFIRELSPSPANRERDLLQEYKNLYLRLPPCNAALANRYSF